MKNTTKIVKVWELYQQGIARSHIVKHLNIHRETIGLWIKGIEKIGVYLFLENYLNAKKGKRLKRQLDPILKRRIWDKREKENDCCGEKIQYFLSERLDRFGKKVEGWFRLKSYEEREDGLRLVAAHSDVILAKVLDHLGGVDDQSQPTTGTDHESLKRCFLLPAKAENLSRYLQQPK